eukprot:scaffold233064_cov33-Tisochrysis_lutea.AAC.1
MSGMRRASARTILPSSAGSLPSRTPKLRRSASKKTSRLNPIGCGARRCLLCCLKLAQVASSASSESERLGNVACR